MTTKTFRVFYNEMTPHPPHPVDVVPRDPHSIPDFHSQSEFVAPVLYLPPLLSSLPDRYSVADSSLNSSFPPVVTETRLPDIDPASLSLHKALHHFQSTPDYANTDYAQAFNWSELKLPIDEEREWYCVVFRSKRKSGSDSKPLYDADQLAHEEAIRNGGYNPAYTLLVWSSGPKNWHESRYLYMAKPETRNSRQLSTTSYQRNASRSQLIRGLYSRTTHTA